jgi:starch synthase
VAKLVAAVDGGLNSLKILYISAEVSPFAKVGGLADVAGSLPKALKELGHDVRIAMPGYQMSQGNARLVDEFEVEINSHWIKRVWVKEAALEDVPVYLIGTDEWFTESDRSERVYQPGSDAYLFFTIAVIQACEELGWIPDVVHCNDWHTGFIPVVLKERESAKWSKVATAYTIHNLAYQGEFGTDVLDKLHLPSHLYNMHQLETFGFVNFLKAGCVYADQVNTVSPTYSREIQTPEFGCRLEGLMQHLAEAGRLHGILNGIDMHEFDPASDRRIPANFSAGDPSGKSICRKELLAELGLPEVDGAPVMGVVSRLSSQKGMDLMIEAAHEMFDLPAQLIVLGTGDHWLAERYRELQEKFPERCRFIERFDVELAQRIYAGSDIFLMPSAFEPCGLGQMIALRYGTIPVVRATGGLADTVFEGRNGFVFHERTAHAFMDAVRRAHKAYGGEGWQGLVLNALKGDYGWSKSAVEYEKMYERALKSRVSHRSKAS